MDHGQIRLSNKIGGSSCPVHHLSIVLFAPSNNSLKLNWSRASVKLHTLKFSARNWLCSCTRNLVWIMSLRRERLRQHPNWVRQWRQRWATEEKGAVASRFFPLWSAPLSKRWPAR
jgi:hypothetical protein